MFPWFLKQKEQNMALTEATETMLPIPFATAAKKMSIDNLDKRIKQAEKAIFNEVCKFINEQIEKGYLLANVDFYTPVYHTDGKLDVNSIIAAGNECININGIQNAYLLEEIKKKKTTSFLIAT